MKGHIKDFLFAATILLCISAIPYSFAGMILAAIPYSFAGMILAALHPKGFASIGLKIPGNWWRNVGTALVLAIAIVFSVQWLITPSIHYFTDETLNLSVYKPLVGDVRLLVFYLIIGLVVGGISEELVFRGFLLQWITHYIPGKSGMVIAVIIPSILFGYYLQYQGLTGLIQSGIVGAIIAIIVLLNQRKLVLRMLTHGFVNSISIMMIYFGIYEI